MGSVYPCPDRSGTKLITNITHLPAVPVAGLQAIGSRPLAGRIWAWFWPLAQKAKCPLATPTPQDVVLLQLAGATISSGSAEDLPRAAPFLVPPTLLSFRAIR